MTNSQPGQAALHIPLAKRLEGPVNPVRGVKRKPCPECQGVTRWGVWILKGENMYRFTSETCTACGHEFYLKRV